MEKIIATEISPNGHDKDVLEYFEKNELDLSLEESIVYYGFPVFKDYEDASVKSNFCILSKHHGIFLISVTNQHDLECDDDNLSQLYSFVESALKKSKVIRVNKKKLALDLDSFIYASEVDCDEDDCENEILSSHQDLSAIFVDNLMESPLSDEVFDEARSIIEGSKALTRASKRTKISDDPTSKLNVLIELEKEVSNFDVEQRKIAISLINGPQRIRGLAGSGKTIVLAMKAAHIHLQHPTKRILFTFYTKSLYGLIKESIARFFRHFAGDEPNWDYIDILHSWGGRSIDGVYFNVCMENSIASMSFQAAKARSQNDPFSVVCLDLENKKVSSKYEYILIDEAQDLPNEFFRLCYKLANGTNGAEKNIVWAYDELQSIFNVYQRTPEELFGCGEDGNACIDLTSLRANLNFGQSNDLVLYKCYRNPLEVLVCAHALGFAIYSSKPVQMLENKEHWRDVGYTIEDDQELTQGNLVSIQRNRENSPLSIYKHQSVSDVVKYHKAESIDNECQWIADGIETVVKDGIKPHDVLVICLDDRHARSYFSRVSLALTQKGIRSNNLLASNSAAPPFLIEDMVTLSTVHSAKGNEAAMVFACGIDAIYPQRAFRNGRNKLFTAFTRTKAWLRVSGLGEQAQYFFNEIDQSLEHSPNLVFTVPSAAEIETIQRDLNAKPTEIVKLQEVVGDLIDQGYTQEQIQKELRLFSKEAENE